jgi:hypothetical protein
MSATDAATYPKGNTVKQLIIPAGAKISPSTQTTTTLTPVVTAVLGGM